MIPYIYLPTSEELTGSAMGIGRTAAQLLQFDQPREAAKLAALAVRLSPQDERLWSVLAEAQLRNEQLDQQVFAGSAKNLIRRNRVFGLQKPIALRAERPDEGSR